MPRVGKVQHRLIDARILQLVDIPAQQREGNRPRNVNASVFQLAVDEHRDRNEPARRGFGHISGPLIDADRPNDLLGLSDLVHLSPGRAGCQSRISKQSAMEDMSHRSVSRLDAISNAKSQRTRFANGEPPKTRGETIHSKQLTVFTMRKTTS